MSVPEDLNAPVVSGPLSRRALLRGAGLTAAGGAGAMLLAACAPAAAPGWTFAPAKSPTAAGGAVQAAASAAPQASSPPLEPAASSEPARPVTTDEISLHPSEMPDSADYGLYADGKYDRLTRRAAGEPLVHEVHFTTKEVVAEVVSGATMEYWTFDGRIPGPMLRARVGDSLDFFLKNDAASLMPHNVDFHAVTGPGGGAAKLDTLPRSESRLKVKLLNPGIYIYHCAFPDVPMHISHGMYGLIVVEPSEGLPAVDREYYLMQSEFYTDRGARLGYTQLKDAGHLPFSNDYANEERPTFVVWNDRPESIAGDRALGKMDDPISTGQTVRLFVGNIGPNLVSSFHSSARSSTPCTSRARSTCATGTSSRRSFRPVAQWAWSSRSRCPARTSSSTTRSSGSTRASPASSSLAAIRSPRSSSRSSSTTFGARAPRATEPASHAIVRALDLGRANRSPAGSSAGLLPFGAGQSTPSARAMTRNKSVWSIRPTTFAAWGPCAATRICEPVCSWEVADDPVP